MSWILSFPCGQIEEKTLPMGAICAYFSSEAGCNIRRGVPRFMTRSRSSKLKKKTTKSDQKQRSLLLTLSATALLILGGGLAYILFQDQDSAQSLPFGSHLLPVDTVHSLTLTTDEQQWKKLQEDFNIPQMRKVVRGSFDQLNAEVLNPQGLNYDEHIKPWVGQYITIAKLAPEAKDGDLLDDESTAWILQIRNQGRAQNFLNKDLLSDSKTVKQETYQDIELRTLKPGSADALTLAILNKSTLVLTSDIPTMRDIIDTATKEASLASQDRFQEAMTVIETSTPFAHFYANVPANTLQISEQEGRQLNKTTVERLQEFQGFGSAIRLTEHGFELKNISWLAPETTDGFTVSKPSEGIAKLLPDDTILMMSGNDFQDIWQEYQQGKETQLFLPFSPKDFQAEVKKNTGIDFEKTFLPWMTDDYLTAIIPQKADSSKNSGIVFMAKARDKTAAENALRELESKMRERYKLQMSETKVNDRAVVTWRVPPNLQVASRGWLDNKVLFFTFFAPITERVTEGDAASLLKSVRFKQATQSEITSEGGQFFLDIPKTVALMETSRILPKLPPVYKKYAKEFDLIGGTSKTPNDWSTRYDIQVHFNKK